MALTIAVRVLVGPTVRLLGTGETVGHVSFTLMGRAQIANDATVADGGVVMFAVNARRHTAGVTIATATGAEVEAVAHGLAASSSSQERALDGRAVITLPLASIAVFT